MKQAVYSTKKIIWVNILFFIITTFVAVVGSPFYIRHFGVALSEILLFVFYMAATGLAITVGYHRLFAHATFKVNPFLRFLFLFFGAAAFEQPALNWASQHRDHHRFVDTDRDPYSIKKGFWYAHIGWLVFWEHPIHYENVKDLSRDPLVMHQHRYYLLWAVSAGIALPLLIGSLTGHLLGAFILSVCLRLTLVYHSTFFINSICHMFGKATYDIYATAKDNGWIALLTYGEGYHNFHHRFPSDYRNGVRWYQWDPSKWLIALFGWCSLAWDLKRVSKFRILEARLSADRKRAEDLLAKVSMQPAIIEHLKGLKMRYEILRERLGQWEQESRHYRSLLQEHFDRCSVAFKDKAHMNLQKAKQGFEAEYQNWKAFLRHELQPLQMGWGV